MKCSIIQIYYQLQKFPLLLSDYGAKLFSACVYSIFILLLLFQFIIAVEKDQFFKFFFFLQFHQFFSILKVTYLLQPTFHSTVNKFRKNMAVNALLLRIHIHILYIHVLFSTQQGVVLLRRVVFKPAIKLT